MEHHNLTKEDHRILDSIADNFNQWTDVDEIVKKARLPRMTCIVHIEHLVVGKLIVERGDNPRYRLTKAGRLIKEIYTWDEKAETYVKEHKSLLWLILGIITALGTILSVILSC